jgi:hypothetical protein
MISVLLTGILVANSAWCSPGLGAALANRDMLSLQDNFGREALAANFLSSTQKILHQTPFFSREICLNSFALPLIYQTNSKWSWLIPLVIGVVGLALPSSVKPSTKESALKKPKGMTQPEREQAMVMALLTAVKSDDLKEVITNPTLRYQFLMGIESVQDRGRGMSLPALMSCIEMVPGMKTLFGMWTKQSASDVGYMEFRNKLPANIQNKMPIAGKTPGPPDERWRHKGWDGQSAIEIKPLRDAVIRWVAVANENHIPREALSLEFGSHETIINIAISGAANLSKSLYERLVKFLPRGIDRLRQKAARDRKYYDLRARAKKLFESAEYQGLILWPNYTADFLRGGLHLIRWQMVCLERAIEVGIKRKEKVEGAQGTPKPMGRPKKVLPKRSA